MDLTLKLALLSFSGAFAGVILWLTASLWLTRKNIHRHYRNRLRHNLFILEASGVLSIIGLICLVCCMIPKK